MSASPGGGVIVPPLPPLPPSVLPTSKSQVEPPSLSKSAVPAAVASVAMTLANVHDDKNSINKETPSISTNANASASASAAVSAAEAQAEAQAQQEYSLPYIVITGLKASIDSSIDQYVKQVADRVTLKEVPVNAGPSSANKPPITSDTTASKFTLVDGDFPKLQVDLYEQMVYHRSGSINMKPLEILVPTRYKIDHKKIIQYFSLKASDEATNTLVSSVVKEYGENNNSLFYKTKNYQKMSYSPSKLNSTIFLIMKIVPMGFKHSLKVLAINTMIF